MRMKIRLITFARLIGETSVRFSRLLVTITSIFGSQSTIEYFDTRDSNPLTSMYLNIRLFCASLIIARNKIFRDVCAHVLEATRIKARVC